jgi:hypothetical protein
MSDTNGNGKAGLYAALIEARAAMPAIPKTAKNPLHDSKYAPLGEVLAVVLPSLHERGVCFMSGVIDTPVGPALRSRLVMAETGEVEECTIPLLPGLGKDKTILPLTPQGLKAACTYAQRTALEVLLALELDDDDDGNAASGHSASGRGGPPAKQERKPAAPAPTSTAKPVDPHAHISPERAKKLSAFRMSLGADAWKESPHSDIATAELTNEQADEIGRWHVNRSKATPAPHVESRAPEVPGEEPSTAGAGEDNGLPFGDAHVPESLTVEQVERLAAAKARRARS